MNVFSKTLSLSTCYIKRMFTLQPLVSSQTLISSSLAMFKLLAIVLFLGASVNCQREDRIAAPTRYVLPYAGLEGYDDQQDNAKEEQPLRRSERIPATAYQYDDGLGEEDYYRPQPRQKVEPESQYQSSTRDSTPSHKDYEQILKTTHLARLRAQAKKQPQLQHPSNIPQPAVEQYLKEVSPTTSTAYQRPSNYLRFGGQPKQEQTEETPRAVKQPSYRYVLQPEHQQKTYPQFQYETQEQLKPLPPKNPTPFNLVAYQNALLAQQKVLAEVESQDEPTSKSSIYVSQNVGKKQKNVKQKSARPLSQPSQQFDYYPQSPRRPQPAYSQESPRYQQPSRNLYQKPETGFEDYPEPKEEQYQPPTRQTKPTPKPRTPIRKPKYQTEEPSEDYPVVPTKEQTKYQNEEPTYDYQPNLKYQPEEQPLNYRRPSGRQPKPPKYQHNLEESQNEKPEYLPYQPKYQTEPAPRRPIQYQPEPELRPVPNRYLSRQQYQEESQQFPQFVDLAYQGSSEVPVRYVARPDSYRNPSIRYFRSLGNPTSYVE